MVSKLFDNEDFGYNKITVERPLRLNFAVSQERLARLEDVSGFVNLAVSKKKEGKAKQEDIAQGEKRQKAILAMLRELGKETKEQIFKDRVVFLKKLSTADKKGKLKLVAAEEKTILEALGEKDEAAEICRDSKGRPEPDADLRDTENVPLREDIATYFKREVLPHVPDLPAPRPSSGEFCAYVLKCSDESFYIGQTENFPRRLREHESGEVGWTAPRFPVVPIHWEVFSTREDAVKREHDLKTGFGRKWLKREYDKGKLAAASRQAGAWIDESKTKVGYEIPLNRLFYQYEPPRQLGEIDAEIKALEKEIFDMLEVKS